MWTETIFLALITGLPATLAALAAMIVALRTERKSDTIIEKATEIHTLTNSNLSKVSAALEVANSRIQGLERLIASQSEAKVIADRVADHTTPRPASDRTRAGDTP